jgi:protein ImuB
MEQDKNSAYLLNMLTARLGHDTCFCLAIGNDHRPEKTWQATQVKKVRSKTITQDPVRATRPLFLLDQPKRLYNHTDRSSLNSLGLIQGPERICFGWWDEKGFSRDYYICQHRNGAIYWIYYQDYESEWYLHGLFS